MNLQRKSIISKKLISLLLVLVALLVVTGCAFLEQAELQGEASREAIEKQLADTNLEDLGDLVYQGQPYVDVNDGKPDFSDKLKCSTSFEYYGKLDKKGRCTGTIANLSKDTMPAKDESRGDIGHIHPTGWLSNQEWERCHLIAWCLSAENDNASNLVTGTHFLNSTGMLPFEVEVAKYIDRTGNHVLYQVEPVFRGDDMVCSGVHMEAESVEDKGQGISFNVYCFNVTPGAEIDYITGKVTKGSKAPEPAQSDDSYKRKYILNTSSHKFHYPSCSGVQTMAEHNKLEFEGTREDVINQGYEPCGSCEP